MTDADAAPKEPEGVTVSPGPAGADTTMKEVEESKSSIPIVSDDDDESSESPHSFEAEMPENAEGTGSEVSDAEENESLSDEGCGDEESDAEEDEGESDGEEDEGESDPEEDEEEELDASALLAFSKRRMEEIAATTAAAEERAQAEAAKSESDDDDDDDDEISEEEDGIEQEGGDVNEAEVRNVDDASPRSGEISPTANNDSIPSDPILKQSNDEDVVMPVDAGDDEKEDSPVACDDEKGASPVAASEASTFREETQPDNITITGGIEDSSEAPSSSEKARPDNTTKVKGIEDPPSAPPARQMPPRPPSRDASASSKDQDSEGSSDKRLRMNRDENADLYKLLAYSKRRLETGTTPGGRSSRRSSIDSKKEKRNGVKSPKNKENSPERSKRKADEEDKKAPPVEGKVESAEKMEVEESTPKSHYDAVEVPDEDCEEEKKDDSIDGEISADIVQQSDSEADVCPEKVIVADEEHVSEDEEDEGSEYISEDEEEDEDEDEDEEDYSSEEELDEFEEFDLDDGLGGDDDVDAAAVEAARLKASTLLSLADAADVVASKATVPSNSSANDRPDQLQNLADSLTASMRDVGASVEKMKDKGASKMKDVEASVSGMKASMKASMRNVMSSASPDAPSADDEVDGKPAGEAEDLTVEGRSARSLQDLQMKTMQKLQSLKQQEERQKEVAASKNRRWFRPRRNLKSNDDEPVFMDWSGTKMSVRKLEEVQKKVKTPMVARKGALNRWCESFVSTCNKVDSMYDG